MSPKDKFYVNPNFLGPFPSEQGKLRALAQHINASFARYLRLLAARTPEQTWKSLPMIYLFARHVTGLADHAFPRSSTRLDASFACASFQSGTMVAAVPCHAPALPAMYILRADYSYNVLDHVSAGCIPGTKSRRSGRKAALLIAQQEACPSLKP